MNTFAISEDADKGFRATSGRHQAIGKTMGEALDSLTAQIPDTDSGTLILIQKRAPDRFFTAAQHDRLENLRQRRDTLTAAERVEWEELVNQELEATIARVDALAILPASL